MMKFGALMLGAVALFGTLGVGLEWAGFSYGQSWTGAYIVFLAVALWFSHRPAQSDLYKCGVLIALFWCANIVCMTVVKDPLYATALTLLQHLLCVLLFCKWNQFALAWVTVLMFALALGQLAGQEWQVAVNLVWAGRCVALAFIAERLTLRQRDSRKDTSNHHGATRHHRQQAYG